MGSKYFVFTIFFIKIIAISCKRYGSLSLVIDDTVSMKTEIDAVVDESSKFMDIILTNSSSQISDVVIVTFNDPVKSTLRLKSSRDKDEVKGALNKIHVHGGLDCPEYSLAGINRALDSSLQNSYLFVFTDASPKDGYVRKRYSGEWMVDRTLQAKEIAGVNKHAQDKETQIFFFITKGHCKNSQPESLFQPYWDIAAATNGQVFKINKKEDIEQFLKYMNIMISGEANVMTRKEIKAGERASISFSVDIQTQYVLVSASSRGEDVILDITSGPTRSYKKTAWTKNNKILNIINPIPGNYTALVEGSGDTTIMVVGRTDFSFQHGFSKTIPPTFSNENLQPIEGKEIHLLVKVFDPTKNVNIETAQITSPDEKTIYYPYLALKKVSDGYYATEQFWAPNDTFIITVIGEDKLTEETIRRTAKTPVQPVPMDTDPVISIQGGGQHEYNTSVLLTCYVKAYPKPVITWMNDEGKKIASLATEKIDKKDFVSKLLINNLKNKRVIYCCAENDEGDVFKRRVDLEPVSPFKVNETLSKAFAAVEFGKQTTLQCDISADIPIEIVWYHIVNGHYIEMNYLAGVHSEYSISNYGINLTINKVNQDYEGQYICKAFVCDDKEMYYELERKIKIEHTAPVIEKTTTAKVTVNEKKSTILTCTILKGYPMPEITWKFKDYRSNVFRLLNAKGDRLQINNVTHLSAGVYKCIARNDLGTEERETAVTVLNRPQANLLVNNKTRIPFEYLSTEEALFTCHVISHSRPVIVWKNGKNEVVTISGNVTKNNDYEYTTEMKMSQFRKSETYYCEAKNEISTTKSNIVYIDVSNPFRKVSTGLDNKVNKKNYGEKIVIPCGITSDFPFKITWYKLSTGEVLQTSDRYLITENGAVLTIKNVGLGTRGKYRCKASIVGDETTQKTHDTTVDLNLEKPEIETKHHDLEVFRDQEALLKCKVLKGFPRPTITWLVKYEETSEFVVLPEVGEELILWPASYHNAGVYKCVLKNLIGSDEGTVKLVVKGPPEILTDNEIVYTAAVGDDVLVIPCDVAGYPKPNITWAPEFSSETKFDVNSNGSLVIKNPTIDVSDKKFVCTATNGFATAQKDFKIFVNGYTDHLAEEASS